MDVMRRKLRPPIRRRMRKLYRGRLWINRLARAAVLSPRVASALLEAARFQPALLRFLTAKIVRDRTRQQARYICRQALTVFAISIAIVIGPTPPGTGVIAEAFGETSSNATSPTSR